MQEGNRKAVLAALFANLGISIAKFVGYFATSSSSMLAEAVHSVADTGNQALLLWGGAAAKQPANAEHPFGYGRERYFWSFVVALVLFTLGSLFAIREGVHKLSDPQPLTNAGWALGILGLGMGFEALSLRTAVKESEKLKGTASWWEFIKHSKTPELPVVLLEDLGALLGLSIAVAGIGLVMLTGDARFDALGSIAIGLLLGVIAIVLAIEMKSLLIGEAASQADLSAIEAALLAGDEVHRLIAMRTEHIGPDRLLIGAKLEFDGSLSFEDLTEAIDAAEGRVRAAISLSAVIYVEPDIWEDRS